MRALQVSPDKALELYSSMLRIRRFEEMVIEHYGKQEMKTPVHLSIGQEAVAAGVCAHLNKDDFIFSTHRNHGHCLAKGMSAASLFAEFYGRSTGCVGGKGGSMHPADLAAGIPGTTAIVGGNIPLAAGAAWAFKMRGEKRVAVAFFGDGASEEGTFHETLNFAALKKLPVLFVCENNLYATASPIGNRQPASSSIAARAGVLGINSLTVDGNDAEKVYRSAGQAIKSMREKNEPQFIEALTYRWYAHVGPVDDTATGHRPARELQSWKSKCPLTCFQEQLRSADILNSEIEERFEETIRHELTEAISSAQHASVPTQTDLLTNVFYGET